MNKYTFSRWLYRGGRPGRIAKFLNWVSAVIASAGLTRNLMVTLEVAGRKSGRIISLPVVFAVVGGRRYLVSMLGDNVQWVQNVRASGGKAVLRDGSCEDILLKEVPVEQRAPILKAYLQRAPGARPHIAVDKDAPISEFEKIAVDYPVFSVSSN